jgi:hypothetical protein
MRGLTVVGLFFASGFLVVLMGTYLWMALNGWPSVEIQANAFREGYLELVMVSLATWTLGLVTAHYLQAAADEQAPGDRDGEASASGGPPALDGEDLESPVVEEP